MGKKKPFVDKKKSSTYHVLHRSQRDVSQHLFHEGDTDAAGFILWPSEGNNPETDRAVLGGGGGRGETTRATGTTTTTSGEDRMEQWRQKLKQSGLLDEGNEPDRYLKEITGAGTFLSANGKIGDAFAAGGRSGTTLAKMPTDTDMLEVKEQFDNIPLAEALDPEMAAILYGDSNEVDFDDLEDLNDEFVLDAAQQVVDDDQQQEFDYDSHIQKLMDKARQERHATSATNNRLDQQLPGHEWAQKDSNFFAQAHALLERDNEEETDNYHHHDGDDDSFANIDESILYSTTTTTAPGAVAKLSPEEERALCEKFEQTLLEYDSDEIGDNPEEEIEGPLPLEGDQQVETALDDYLQEKEDEIFMQGRQRGGMMRLDNGGSGFSALVGTRMVAAKELDIQNGYSGPAGTSPTAEPIEQVLAEAKARLAEPPQQPPPEEILIDGQSYFSERVRNPWDCESVLSTYSNLDNNPVTIDGAASSWKRSKRRRGKHNQAAVHCEQEDDEDPLEQIKLSNKTGLPLGVLPSSRSKADVDDDDDEFTGTTMMSVNKGEARRKQETVQEKKARKAAVKRERQMARIQKKVTRDVFQEEFAKHAVNVGGDAVAGKPVFRY